MLDTERLLLKALAENGYAYVDGHIVKKEKKEPEDVENEGEVRYNRTVRYISYSTIGEENVNHIRGALRSMYRGFDNVVADGIAIEKDNTVYIVDSGKEKGDIRFGVREKHTIQDAALRSKYIEEVNHDAISKRYVSDELSEIVANRYSNDRGRDRGRQPGKELSTDKGKSTDNQSGVSETDGSQGKETLRLSRSLPEITEENLSKKEAGYRSFAKTDGATVKNGRKVRKDI